MIIDKDVQQLCDSLEINEYLYKKGYNGFETKWTVREAAEQVVNGKNIIFRVTSHPTDFETGENSMDLSMCVKIFQNLQQDIEITEIRPCASWLDVVD
tara:strand:+ start:2237 stop:2530 length:294 start_codon:yes stop_codon:yes gene_type:complete